MLFPKETSIWKTDKREWEIVPAWMESLNIILIEIEIINSL